MIRYSNPLLMFFAIFCFLFLFSGRGFSFPVNEVNISYGILFGLIPCFIFFKNSSFNFLIRSSLGMIATIIILIFFFYSFFSLFYSQSFNYGLDKTLNLFLFFIVGVLFVSLLEENELLLLFKYLIYLIFPLALAYILLNLIIGFQSRIGLLGAGSITTGRIFSFACILSMFFLVEEKKIKYLFIFIILLIAVFLSGSRGNFLFIIIALSIPWVFNNFKVFLKIFLIFLVFSYLVFKFSLYENIPFVSRYFLLFEGGGESILVRFDAFKLAASIFQNNFFSGVGAGGYSFYSLGYDGFDYPHNIFFEIAAELGFFGLILFLFIIFFSFIIGLRNFFILSLLVFYVLVSSGSGDLYDARFIFVLFLFGCVLKKRLI